LAIGALAREVECRRYGRSCGGPLHGHGVDQHTRPWKAVGEHPQDVAQGGARGGSDHPDARRSRGQALLALDGKQSFRAEARAQLFVGELQVASPRILQLLDQQLVIAARLVEADSPARHHQLAFARCEWREGIALAKHSAAQLRVAILEREIPVARARAREVRDLTLYPDRPQPGFQQDPCLAIEARHAVDVSNRRVGRRAHEAF
jgi:hypothetical protein